MRHHLGTMEPNNRQTIRTDYGVSFLLLDSPHNTSRPTSAKHVTETVLECAPQTNKNASLELISPTTTLHNNTFLQWESFREHQCNSSKHHTTKERALTKNHKCITPKAKVVQGQRQIQHQVPTTNCSYDWMLSIESREKENRDKRKDTKQPTARIFILTANEKLNKLGNSLDCFIPFHLIEPVAILQPTSVEFPRFSQEVIRLSESLLHRLDKRANTFFTSYSQYITFMIVCSLRFWRSSSIYLSFPKGRDFHSLIFNVVQ